MKQIKCNRRQSKSATFLEDRVELSSLAEWRATSIGAQGDAVAPFLPCEFWSAFVLSAILLSLLLGNKFQLHHNRKSKLCFGWRVSCNIIALEDALSPSGDGFRKSVCRDDR